MVTATWTVQNSAVLGAPGDEYNKSPCREGRAGLLEDKTHRPIRPQEYCQIPFFPKHRELTMGTNRSADDFTRQRETPWQ